MEKVISVLLPLTEQMLTDETATVRETALLNIVEIAKSLESEQIVAHVLPVVTRLADNLNEVGYTGRQYLTLFRRNIESRLRS